MEMSVRLKGSKCLTLLLVPPVVPHRRLQKFRERLLLALEASGLKFGSNKWSFFPENPELWEGNPFTQHTVLQ